MTARTPRREDTVERIRKLRKNLNAVILAHNYQRPEVQDAADMLGDSLELARAAARTDADVLVLCAVRFMAETAAIVNPSRLVLLAEGTAGCPMADMITVDDLREWKARYPRAAVVCYVNSSAAVKAESDYCCTSANAARVVEAVPSDEILFIPDRNLGHYVSRTTGKKIILYPGYCVVHARLSPKQVARAKDEHPDAVVLVHPECRPEVVEMADAVLSTSQMIRYARESAANSFLIGTEQGLIYRMAKENPGKSFHPISASTVCPEMKKTTLGDLLRTMEAKENVVDVPEEMRSKARLALDRMLEIT